MAAGEKGGDESAQVTEETPAFRDANETHPPIDPWVELTDAGADEEDEDDPDVVDAVAWVEQEFPPDGPVAAPLDAPVASFDQALAPTADLEPPPLRERPRPPSMRSRLLDELEPSHYQQEVRQLLSPERPAPINRPVVVARKTPARKASRTEVIPRSQDSGTGKASRPEVVAGKRELTSAHERGRAKAPERRYPKMMGLLKNSDAVPYGIAPEREPPPPPVPGTFFPAPRPPLFERPAPADLDELLATMAEGLLIGETPDGGTEVRVTLRDEFFAGTELRIRVVGGEVSAQLMPPDRDIYWQLNGNLDELRERLADRGLTVAELTVLEP